MALRKFWIGSVGPFLVDDVEYPEIFRVEGGNNALADHGQLVGLGDNDHPQYLRVVDNTAASILAKLLTVDGIDSGLDANLLDGQPSTYYQPASTALKTTNTDGRGREEQCFLLQLRNNGGTLEHRVVSLSQTGITDYTMTSKVIGDSPAWTTTPTGADSSTNFATGVKIGTTATHSLILNTADQTTNGDQAFHADLSLSDVTGSKALIRARCQIQSRNVNDVTIYRPEILFQYLDTATPMTWTNFVLNTTNIPSGKVLSVRCHGPLR